MTFLEENVSIHEEMQYASQYSSNAYSCTRKFRFQTIGHALIRHNSRSDGDLDRANRSAENTPHRREEFIVHDWTSYEWI